MQQVNELKTIGRAIALVLLVGTTLGPWLTDSHPATVETCQAPLVWLGDGLCACLVSLVAALGQAIRPGQGTLLLFGLPPALPFATSLYHLTGGAGKFARSLHLAAWGLAVAFSLFLFVGIWVSYPQIRLWGAGLCGLLSVAVLAGEILAARFRLSPAHSPIGR